VSVSVLFDLSRMTKSDIRLCEHSYVCVGVYFSVCLYVCAHPCKSLEVKCHEFESGLVYTCAMTCCWHDAFT